MKIEEIDTSSAYVPIGRLFIVTQQICENEELFLAECLKKDDISIAVEERVVIELNDFSDSIKLMIQDLENSKMKSRYISTIQNIVSVTGLSHDPASAGGSFLIKCLNGIYYINWHRES
ncbi:hypothetical protein [Pseudoalteromonas ulvae]|uniref:Uncharacterized protein n=1 Tax=Pseudoalteromonas ulvae TaxID=107327 RepID=A0A244CLR8_PSEDV|nr:hypothetical protein [Pseudoalteromonas ulvae]OUL56488.1 hypothetical protein B1199_17655 [Pseudoalteromonas ulvae]